MSIPAHEAKSRLIDLLMLQAIQEMFRWKGAWIH